MLANLWSYRTIFHFCFTHKIFSYAPLPCKLLKLPSSASASAPTSALPLALAESGGMPCQLVWKIDFYGLSCASSVTTKQQRGAGGAGAGRRDVVAVHTALADWGGTNQGRERTNPAGVPFCVSIASFKRHLPVILCRVWHSFPQRNFSLANNANGWAGPSGVQGREWWECH